MKDQREAARAECLKKLFRIVRVRELAFDGREARQGRCVESLEKGTLGKERAQVRGEPQSALPPAVMASTGTLRNISLRSGRMNENR